MTLGFAQVFKGRPDRCKEEFDQAARLYRRPGPLARSDLAAHWSQLHVITGDFETAAIEADQAVKLVRPLAAKSPPSRHRYRPASVLPRSAYATALLVRAEVRLCQGSAKDALSDTLLALSWVDPRYSSHIYISGITRLGRILVTPGVATPDLAHQVLRICRHAHKILGARKVRSKHPHRVKVRALEALALATLGSLEKAEYLLTRSIEELRDAGLEQDARIILEHMVWLVGHRLGQTGRARMLAARYGLPADAVPKAPKPPKVEDDDEPIGF